MLIWGKNSKISPNSIKTEKITYVGFFVKK